jgi:hypothetical protein
MSAAVPETASIGGEVLSVGSAPARDSRLVQVARDEILCTCAPDEFAASIEAVAHIMSAAYDSAVALDQTDVSIAVQDIGYSLTQVTESAHLTMFGLGVAAAGAVADLEGALAELYAPGGIDAVALSMLDAVESTAGRMRERSTAMAARFQDMAGAARAALETTQTAIAARVDELVRRRREACATEGLVAEAAEAHAALTRCVRDADAALSEARARERWAHRRGAWVRFADDCTRAVQPLFGTEAAVGECVARNRRDAKQAARNAGQIAADRLDAVERKSQAVRDIVLLVQKIRRSRTQADLAAVLVEALHLAAGALKRLSANMLKTATMWSQLEVHAARLGSPDELSRLVRAGCASYPEDDGRRAAFWRSAAFKRRAVIYMSRWVAIADVGRAAAAPLSAARRALYCFLESHPSYQTVAAHLESL